MREDRGWTPATPRWTVLYFVILALVCVGVVGAVWGGTIAHIGALPNPAPSPVPSSSAFGCREAQELTDEGQPQRAKTLIANENLSCPGESASARRASSATAPSGTDLRSTLRFGKLWQQRVVEFVTPLEYPVATGAVVLLVFFVVARMFVYLPRIWYFAFGPFVEKRKSLRYIAGFLGVAAMVSAAPASVILLTLGHLWLTTLFVVVGLAGSLLFASFLATQLRVRISVQSAGSDDVAQVARVAALMNELGGAQPSGLEAPVGADITDLKSAVVTVPDGNPFIEAVKWVVTALFTSAPWHVLVGVSEELVSVTISRNLRSFAAVDISPDLLYRPAEKAQSARAEASTVANAAGRSATGSPSTVSQAPGTDPGKVRSSVLADYLLEFAAAAVVTSLAREHPGFKGLSGERAADWISVGLQFVATSRFADDKETQQALLTAALNRDPTNLLADVALQNLIYEKATSSDDQRRYLRWIEGKLYSLRLRPEHPFDVMVGRRAEDPDPRALAGEALEPFAQKGTSWSLRGRLRRSGYVDLYRRLLFSYLVVSLNLRAPELLAGMGRDQRFTVGALGAVRAAEWACESVENDMPLSGTLRNRMRFNFALFYSDAVLADPPDHYRAWYRIAMTTSASSVAFNAAGVLADRWWVEEASDDANDGVRDKDRWLELLKERLRIACIDPTYQLKARTDPMFVRFEGQRWFEKMVGRSTVPPAIATRRVHRIVSAARRRR